MRFSLGAFTLGNQLSYDSWSEFEQADPKKAAIWVERVPLIIDFSVGNSDGLKSRWQDLVDHRQECVEKNEKSKKYALAEGVDCPFFVTDEYEVQWYVTSMKKAEQATSQ